MRPVSATALAPLTVRRRRYGPVTTVEVQGELDLATTEQLEQELDRVEETSPGLVLLDLRELEFIGATGVRTLLAAEHRIRCRDALLVVVPGPPAVQYVFELTGTTARFRFARTVLAPGEVIETDGGWGIGPAGGA